MQRTGGWGGGGYRGGRTGGYRGGGEGSGGYKGGGESSGGYRGRGEDSGGYRGGEGNGDYRDGGDGRERGRGGRGDGRGRGRGSGRDRGGGYSSSRGAGGGGYNGGQNLHLHPNKYQRQQRWMQENQGDNSQSYDNIEHSRSGYMNYGQRSDINYGERRDSDYDERRERDYGQRSNIDYGERRDRDFGERRDLDYGERRDRDYGQRSERDYSRTGHLEYSQVSYDRSQEWPQRGRDDVSGNADNYIRSNQSRRMGGYISGNGGIGGSDGHGSYSQSRSRNSSNRVEPPRGGYSGVSVEPPSGGYSGGSSRFRVPDPSGGSGLADHTVTPIIPCKSDYPERSSVLSLNLHLQDVSAKMASSSDNTDRAVPIKRPDQGGKLAIRTARLHVNHFPVKFDPESIIMHYDIDVKPDAVPKNGRPAKISKSNLTLIRNKLFADNPAKFPLSMTAYDGEKNIFSAVRLPTGKFKVNFSEAEDLKESTYTFTIKLVGELKLCKLKDYISGKLFSIPRDILQGMDVVMKENPARNMVSVGRTFHSVQSYEKDDLGFGITASRGFQHSLKPTSQGLAMCLDYSVLAFRKRLPVIDFLYQHIPGFDLHDFRQFRRDVENALQGLKVTVTHRLTKQKYTIFGLTKYDTRHISFLAEDPDGKAPQQEVFLVEYFRQKYRDIQHKDIPCLDLGKNNRKNYVPMEFCVLVEGQVYPKENLDKHAAVFLKNMSLAAPHDRQRIICEMVRAKEGPRGGNIIQNFRMDVGMDMTSVEGRVISPPELKLSASNGRVMKISVDKEKCHWNLVGKGVVEGKTIDRWAVLDFSSSDHRGQLRSDQFISKLMARCEKLGIFMKGPLFCYPATMNKFSNLDMLHDLLEAVNDRAYKTCRGKLQILLCVMSRKDPGYKYLKWISETQVGVVTQCCLSTHANKGNDQYLANLALKINAKLGGSNVELMDQLPCFEATDHVMFVGADVNHPGARNTTSPSIAAVVATVNWPAANRYAARVRPQDHRKEKIVNFADMCLDLAETYARLNKVKPANIVIFRDGVSEGQFDMVLNEELLDLKKVFEAINYNPTITLIVAQKRHQTRLFPLRKEGSYNLNVSPGTVVDTKIVHPFEFDFYLCSHYGSLGTSKPTHYHVLWDDHGFSSDQLQKLIYNMCYTFARCTKPVSLVPPVYYADLVAYRGRLYYEAVIEGYSPSSAMSTSSSLASSSLSSAPSFDDRFYKLHADLENIMFFV